ncbi:MAG: hypothetical protein JST19_15005 [Bacteroidetes bacterium]|nr:hypothetical protein [Bacteroidota bacterium]
METQERTAPITGREGAEIDVKIAAEWTKNYRDRHPGQTISQFFGIELLQNLLQQPGCMGIRIYYANSEPVNDWHCAMMADPNFAKNMADAHGQDHLILTGVTKEGLDMFPGGARGAHELKTMSATTSGSTSDSGGLLVEQAHPCPGSVGCPQNALTGN